MLDSKYTVGISIALFYLALKFIELKFITKDEEKSLKILFRDALLVYVSTIGGIFILEQFAPLTESIGKSPIVFTSDPDF
jgi:hypothetical protein